MRKFKVAKNINKEALPMGLRIPYLIGWIIFSIIVLLICFSTFSWQGFVALPILILTSYFVAKYFSQNKISIGDTYPETIINDNFR